MSLGIDPVSHITSDKTAAETLLADRDAGDDSSSQGNEYQVTVTGRQGLQVLPGTGDRNVMPGETGRDPSRGADLDIAPGAGGSQPELPEDFDPDQWGEDLSLVDVGQGGELVPWWKAYQTELIIGGVAAAALLTIYLATRKG